MPTFARKVFIDKNKVHTFLITVCVPCPSVVLYCLIFQLEEAIEIALATGCKVHGFQEGVTKKDVLEFVKKVDIMYQVRML